MISSFNLYVFLVTLIETGTSRITVAQGNVKGWGEEPNRLTRSLWNELIRRVCPERKKEIGTLELWNWTSLDQTRRALKEMRAAVMDLVAILRLMGNPRLLLLDLLECIFKRFSEDEEGFGAEYLRHDPDLGPKLFQLSCPQHGSHVVSPLGFLLLDTNAVLIFSYRKYRKNCKYGLGHCLTVSHQSSMQYLNVKSTNHYIAPNVSF